MKKLELKFPTGSVIKDYYNHIWIVVEHKADKKTDGTINEYVRVISFSSSNSAGSINYKTIIHTEICQDCAEFGKDLACEACDGTGTVTITRHGLDKCKHLASNVKDYILKSLTKNFDF